MKPLDFTGLFLVILVAFVTGTPLWAKGLPKGVGRQGVAPPAGRVLAGTENNPNMAWSAVTDKDIYNRGETLLVKVTNNGYKRQKLIKNVWIERFHGRVWAEHSKIEVSGKAKSLATGDSTEFLWTIPVGQAYGRYRLVIFTCGDFSVPPVFSNEFYVRQN